MVRTQFRSCIHLKFNGSAGQSLGAFCPKGMTFELEGDANDYIGKGVCGAKIIVYPPKNSPPELVADQNIIVGNVAFYGATAGEAYMAGVAGERFCVRNSGATAVVEGVGDHGCEYMTGGRVIVLGQTGRNFGAGMSGGIAYVYDRVGDFDRKVNYEMVALEDLDGADREFLHTTIERHHDVTGSPVAEEILASWTVAVGRFRKVMPIDYKRVLREKGDLSVGVPGPGAAQPQGLPVAE